MVENSIVEQVGSSLIAFFVIFFGLLYFRYFVIYFHDRFSNSSWDLMYDFISYDVRDSFLVVVCIHIPLPHCIHSYWFNFYLSLL